MGRGEWGIRSTSLKKGRPFKIFREAYPPNPATPGLASVSVQQTLIATNQHQGPSN